MERNLRSTCMACVCFEHYNHSTETPPPLPSISPHQPQNISYRRLPPTFEISSSHSYQKKLIIYDTGVSEFQNLIRRTYVWVIYVTFVYHISRQTIHKSKFISNFAPKPLLDSVEEKHNLYGSISLFHCINVDEGCGKV